MKRRHWASMTRKERSDYMRWVRATPREQKTVEECRDHLMNRTITTESGCLEFTGCKDPLGYGKVRLWGKPMLAHRASYLLNIGDIPHGMLVCHKCDRPQCINPKHLFIGGHLDNTMDAVRKGRKVVPHPFGETHGTSKLKNADVKRIRKLAGLGVPQPKIAAQFNITQCTVSDIHRRKTWKHLQ